LPNPFFFSYFLFVQGFSLFLPAFPPLFFRYPPPLADEAFLRLYLLPALRITTVNLFHTSLLQTLLTEFYYFPFCVASSADRCFLPAIPFPSDFFGVLSLPPFFAPSSPLEGIIPLQRIAQLELPNQCD